MLKLLCKIRNNMAKAGEKAMEKANDLNEKAINKANGYIETYLNSEGTEKVKAKACLMQMTGAYPSFKVDYLGGSPVLPDPKEGIRVQAIPQGLVFSDYLLDFIPFEAIDGVQFKTEQQIEKDVTIPRMVAFGIYSLALKKKRTHTYKYLVISCKGVYPYKIVLAGDHASYLYQEIHRQRLA
ncbi:hypothetical protein [Clostridium perfringens]|uniref:hypothetical protein n=1 Tax=Clostridium perfringens TaxID=1502 RepID=UPI0034A35F94